MPMSIGGGALAGLESILAERFQEQLERQRAAEQQQQFGLQQQQIDLQRRRVDAETAPQPEKPIVVGGRLVSPRGEVIFEPPAERTKPIVVGGRLIDPDTQEVLYEPPAEPAKPIPVASGARLVDPNTMQVLLDANQTGGSGGGGGATGGAEGKPSGLAEMVLNNPDLLKEMTPTARTQVLQEIASSGGELPNRRLESIKHITQQALDTISTLRDTPGMSGAVGAPSLTQPGSWSRLLGMAPLAGSASAGYQRYIDTLKAQLTLPRLEFLRGLGHMSDREFKSVADSVSALDPSMSEEMFMKELTNIETTLRNVQERLQLSAPEDAPQAAQAGMGGGAPAGGGDIDALRGRYGY